MTRFVVRLTLAAVLLMGVTPAMAGDRFWNYGSHAGYPTQTYYPAPSPVTQERPLLKKLVIGGILVGVGFLFYINSILCFENNWRSFTLF